MARYGVLIERDAEGYTAWAPVIPGAYGYGGTRAEATRHLAEAVSALLETEPAGLEDLDEDRDLRGVEAHILEITRSAKPVVHEQHLAGISNLAETLGVSRQTVWNWVRRHDDFPPPVAHTAAGPVWASDPVERWARSHGKGGAGASSGGSRKRTQLTT